MVQQDVRTKVPQRLMRPRKWNRLDSKNIERKGRVKGFGGAHLDRPLWSNHSPSNSAYIQL